MLNKIEQRRQYLKEWRKKHPEKLEEYKHRRAERTKERYRTDPEYHKKIMEENSNYYKIKYAKMRKKVIQKLGEKCIYCGCNVYDALEINHINGGGNEELRGNHPYKAGCKSRWKFYSEILKEERKDIELVCRVCNSVHWLKLKGITGYKVSWNTK